MQDNDWQKVRKLLLFSKHPKDLDFSKTVGGTTYIIKSNFSSRTNESMLGKVLRLLNDNKNLSD